MGGLTLLSLFAASEIGGSAPVHVLKPTGTEVLAGRRRRPDGHARAVQSAVSRLING